eukprot:TRINITY_DN1871_c0_g2_i10.p1 TRINITY_DN1871_c0_g2~~TRINITY_DN1871_c0_g2_i10.p1  ORF type:complete len:253 (+),score=59.82 TRINITY_DN1871_c0_g2_i10:35-760(+)
MHKKQRLRLVCLSITMIALLGSLILSAHATKLDLSRRTTALTLSKGKHAKTIALSPNTRKSPSILVLATADGRLLGLDPLLGEIHWQIETNTPLLHASVDSINRTDASETNPSFVRPRRNERSKDENDGWDRDAGDVDGDSDIELELDDSDDDVDDDDSGESSQQRGSFEPFSESDTQERLHPVMLPGRDGSLYAQWNDGNFQVCVLLLVDFVDVGLSFLISLFEQYGWIDVRIWWSLVMV